MPLFKFLDSRGSVFAPPRRFISPAFLDFVPFFCYLKIL